MRLVHLLNGWAFLFGKNLHTAQIIAMDGEDRFFRSRTEAVAAAKRHGLKVSKNGSVSSDGSPSKANQAGHGAYRTWIVVYKNRRFDGDLVVKVFAETEKDARRTAKDSEGSNIIIVSARPENFNRAGSYDVREIGRTGDPMELEEYAWQVAERLVRRHRFTTDQANAAINEWSKKVRGGWATATPATRTAKDIAYYYDEERVT